MTCQDDRVPTETVLLNQNTGSVVTLAKVNDSSRSRCLIYMKIITLVSLALHGAGNTTLIYFVHKTPDSHYIKSTFVLICEIQKAILSFIILIIIEEHSLIGALKTIYNKILLQPKDTMKMIIPAAIYTLQNNLNLETMSTLPPAKFVVVNQLKIFTTAIFTVIMLHRRLGLIQWCALLILFLGVSVVKIETLTSKTSKDNIDVVKILLFVIIACICSGLAGVYFEKVLKGSDVSLWVRELQLAGLSLVCSSLVVYFWNADEVKAQGFLNGYSSIVWFATVVNSVGGLLVALVVKYADNILKGFASSSAIVLSSIISVAFLNFQITPLYALGSLFVIFSIFLYNKPDLVLHVPIINSLIKDNKGNAYFYAEQLRYANETVSDSECTFSYTSIREI